jgi:Concanavalin A-like lectin/glucanases superfamily
VSAGSWQHVVGTFDGSSLRLYKNGSLVAGPKSASPATSANPGGWIGSFSGTQFFNGDIDEVRISNTNRGADWIRTEYNNQNSPGTFITMGSESCPSGTPTPTPTPTATPTPTPGLVAAYGFNEGSGTVVHDVSGNGNDGSISGATWTTSGKYGDALRFNGTNARVNINNATSLQLRSGMTLEAWVYPTSVSSAWRDVIYKGNDNYYLEGTSPNSSRPAMGGTFGGTLYGTSPLTANTWAHLAASYDGATMRLYVNGVQVASRAQTGAIATSTNPLQVGGDSIYGQYFAGRIDEVRIYNRALSAAQIQNDMNTPL